MRVYVASAFRNKAAVKDAIRLLRAVGHTISHDWTDEDSNHLSTGSAEWTSYRESCGGMDFAGVTTADAVLFLVHPLGKDSFTECGIALGRDIPVIAVEPERNPSVFFGMCRKAKDLTEALGLLRRIEERANARSAAT